MLLFLLQLKLLSLLIGFLLNLLFLLSLFKFLLVYQRLLLSNSVEVVSQTFPNLLFSLTLGLFGKANLAANRLLL